MLPWPDIVLMPGKTQWRDTRMRWERATTVVRLICLLLSAGSFAVAWRLTWIGSQGIDDVPPPFTLVAGLAGIGFFCIAAIGRYPAPGVGGPRGKAPRPTVDERID
jgi:hypothetical protein